MVPRRSFLSINLSYLIYRSNIFCLDEFCFFPTKQRAKSYQSRCKSEVPLCVSHISVLLTPLLQYENSTCYFPFAIRRIKMLIKLRRLILSDQLYYVNAKFLRFFSPKNNWIQHCSVSSCSGSTIILTRFCH